jgi:hypothetical protein
VSAVAAPRCSGCCFFNPAARDLEQQLLGLNILSSAYASVRSGDGLCDQHQRYVAASSYCAAYQAQAAVQPA